MLARLNTGIKPHWQATNLFAFAALKIPRPLLYVCVVSHTKAF